MGEPFLVATVTTLFPLPPTEAYNSNSYIFQGDRYKHGLCEYHLPADRNQATFRATLDAWLELLEPYHAVLHQFRMQGYDCFLEIWTDADNATCAFDHQLLQRTAALSIDLDIRVDSHAEAPMPH
jgi:hypothetical protein